MLKLISLGAAAILLAALTPSLHADAADGMCDILKDKQYTRGLYGICVAYWSGDADKSKLEDKYYARRQDGDPEFLPGTGPSIEEPDPVEDICPCWNAEELAELTYGTEPGACGTSQFDPDDPTVGHEFAMFNMGDLQVMAGVPFPGIPASCSIQGLDAKGNVVYLVLGTTAGEDADCREVVRGLSDLFFESGMDCGWTE